MVLSSSRKSRRRCNTCPTDQSSSRITEEYSCWEVPRCIEFFRHRERLMRHRVREIQQEWIAAIPIQKIEGAIGIVAGKLPCTTGYCATSSFFTICTGRISLEYRIP